MSPADNPEVLREALAEFATPIAAALLGAMPDDEGYYFGLMLGRIVDGTVNGVFLSSLPPDEQVLRLRNMADAIERGEHKRSVIAVEMRGGGNGH